MKERSNAMSSIEPVRRFDASRVPPLKGYSAIHPAPNPLDVEIGAGVGFFAIRYSTNNPDRTLISIEHTSAKFKSFEQRLNHHPALSNLHAVHADAVSYVTHALSPQSVDRYFFLYPNPNPKPSHRSKRWAAMPFMVKVIETMKPGGTLTLATNEKFYFEEAKEYFEKVWNLEIAMTSLITADHCPPGFPRTHFEKKYLARKQTCFDLIVRKPS